MLSRMHTKQRLSVRQHCRLPTSTKLVAAGLLACLSACSDDPPADAKKDVTAAVSDVSEDTALAADTGGLTIPSGKHVGADLTPHLPSLQGTGAYVRLYEAKDAFKGSAAQAKLGDWVIGNAHLRIAIQGPDRHIGVCPWGGNALDGSRLGPDGKWSDDEMGEQCLLFNLGRTLKAEHFEVLADGKDGGPVILAVTGEDTLLDFINLPSLLGGFLGLDTELPMDPDADMPVTITRYFILGADTKAMQVVTAFRNDSDKEIIVGTGELIDSGGEVEFFNPAGSAKGFGTGGGFAGQKLDYVAFRSPFGSHAYAPPLVNGKPGASYLAVGGAAGILLGSDNLLPLLLGGKESFEKSAAAVRIAAGAVVTRVHTTTVGTGEVNSLSGPIWQARGATLRSVNGTAKDAAGGVIANARISALLNGAAHTQVVSDKDGKFTLELPEGGAWTVLGWHQGFGLSEAVAAGADGIALKFGGGGALKVKIVNGAAKPRPGKVTVYCDKECAPVPATVRDGGLNGPGGGAYVAEFVGMDGELLIPLPAGKYRVVVTGGPTATIWPEDAIDSGDPLTIEAGKTANRTATIRTAVDTSGWLSGDFHVHSVNSPDAAVENVRRVLSFLAEGVDVLVPTDHDFITDMAPIIATQKGQARLASMPGIESTSFDYGHFNAFPLKHDPQDLNGGALDWAGGDGPGLDPPAIRAALSKQGAHGPAVVQINHPQSYLNTIQVDMLGGISLAPRDPFRVTAKSPNPVNGDTGMFTDDFSAMEILTGHRGGGFGGGDGFAQNLNWWFSVLSRGVRWTGTATSDTHRSLSSQSGGSRTYIRVGAGKDDILKFDAKHFTEAILAGKAVGSDGPMLQMWAKTKSATAAIGDTIAVNAAETVTITVEVQGPEWMDLQRVELYLTPTETFAPVGVAMADMPKPFAVFALKPEDHAPVAGKEAKSKRWVLTATFALKGLQTDGYVVAIAHGDEPMPKALYGGRDVKPLAFTNPIYLDADGGGYNHPPLTKKAQKPPPPPPPRPKRVPTAKELRQVLEAIACH